MVKIAEASGSKVDNTLKLELLKREEEAIRLEREQLVKAEAERKKKADEEAEKKKKEEAESIPTPDTAPTLVDNAPIDTLRNVKEVLVDQAALLKDKAPKSMYQYKYSFFILVSVNQSFTMGFS